MGTIIISYQFTRKCLLIVKKKISDWNTCICMFIYDTSFWVIATIEIVVAVSQNNYIVNVYFSCKEKYKLFILKYSYVTYLYCYLYLVKITNVIKVILF